MNCSINSELAHVAVTVYSGGLSLLKPSTWLKYLIASLAFSVCLRNQSPKKAVELLEQGCGISWYRLLV